MFTNCLRVGDALYAGLAEATISSPEHLHIQVTAQWHATDSQQKENHLLQRLAVENRNDCPGPNGL